MLVDKPSKLTLSATNLNTLDIFTFRLKEGTTTALTVSGVTPLSTISLEVDLTNRLATSMKLGFYSIEMQRLSDGATVTLARQILLTKSGDLWSQTATSTSSEPRDGKIDIFDVSRLLSKWGSTAAADLTEADINGPTGNPDGKIDIYDANKMMANWTP